MDRRRLTRAAVIGAAAISAAACAQQPRVAAVSQTNAISYTSADRECMARAMYFESNRSSTDGMLAVGTIVANRVQSGRYGRTVCDVVATRGQFAPGVMTRTMSGESAELARATADQVLSGKRHPGVKSALHFHTAGMRFRYPNMHYVLVAGGNAFYEKRDSSGGGRAANARSLALALAVGRADPTRSHPIEVAAATPLETPIAPAVSTTVAVTTKPGAAPATTVVTTRVAQAPAAVPAAAQPARIQVAQAQTASAIEAQPAETAAAPSKAFGTKPAAVARTAPAAQAPLQVAAAQPVAAPVPAAAPQRAAKAPVALTRTVAPADQPVAYAQSDAPAVALPKVRPAPKRTISTAAEPMLASVAPTKPSHKAAPAKSAVAEAAAEKTPAPAPVVAESPAENPARSAASGYVASAFAAFD